MSIPLPAGLPYAYSLAEGSTVELTVTGTNPVSYGAADAARENPDGVANPGDPPLELTAPGWLYAEAGSEVELAYPPPIEIEAPPPGDE